MKPTHPRWSSVPTPLVLALLLMCMGAPGCTESSQDITEVDSQREANRILVALERHGIAQSQVQQTVKDRKTKWVLSVPREQASAARQVLVKLDLPREPHSGLAGMVSASGLIPTRSDERARLMHAIAGELEQTFETIDSVLSARVHLVLPTADWSTDKAKPQASSATVLIKHLPRVAADGSVSQEPPVTPEVVKQIVARSVESLDPANVFVAYTLAEPPPQLSAAVAGAASPARSNLVYQMFAVIVAMAVVVVTLAAMLLRKPRAAAAAS